VLRQQELSLVVDLLLQMVVIMLLEDERMALDNEKRYILVR
jgi:hypothetical protein